MRGGSRCSDQSELIASTGTDWTGIGTTGSQPGYHGLVEHGPARSTRCVLTNACTVSNAFGRLDAVLRLVELVGTQWINFGDLQHDGGMMMGRVSDKRAAAYNDCLAD
jgi:hypothetical protein